jgi:hypothetical protein
MGLAHAALTRPAIRRRLAQMLQDMALVEAARALKLRLMTQRAAMALKA